MSSRLLLSVIIGVLLCGPSFADDCHDVVYDAGESRNPVLVMDLLVSIEEWPEVREAFVEFAARSHLSFRDNSFDHGATKKLGLSMCNNQSVNIAVAAYRREAYGFKHPVEGAGIMIPVYTRYVESDWIRFAKNLVHDLRARWPGEVRFLNEVGQQISEAEAFGNG